MDKVTADILLVDGRNLLHRAVHASRSSKKSFRPRHPIVVAFGLIHGWIYRFHPKSIHLFWDCRRDKLWRRRLDKGYKDKPPDEPDVRQMLQSAENGMRLISGAIGIRQYNRDCMEADDLIYSACRVLAPTEVVVCSSDTDYLQLVFRMKHVRVYDPLADRIMETTDHDPVVAKALRGDRSDLVDGYVGIGKVNSVKLAKSVPERNAFLKLKGTKMYARNLALIDLSLCPQVLMNDIYVENILAKTTKFDQQALNSIIKDLKIPGLVTEMTTLTDIGRLAG